MLPVSAHEFQKRTVGPSSDGIRFQYETLISLEVVNTNAPSTYRKEEEAIFICLGSRLFFVSDGLDPKANTEAAEHFALAELLGCIQQQQQQQPLLTRKRALTGCRSPAFGA